MILQELYEGRFSELDIAYQDWLGKLSPKQFKDAYGMDKKTWEVRNRDWINKREAHQRPQPVGDEHLFKENADLNTAQSLGQDLEELYRTLWDAREGPENSRYELKLKKEINIIKNQLERIGYEYDVSTKRVRPTHVAEDLNVYSMGDAECPRCHQHDLTWEERTQHVECRNCGAEFEESGKEIKPGVAEGFQKFGKYEPYWVCINGKKWKRFETYAHARAVHDKIEKKLRDEGSDKKVSLLPADKDVTEALAPGSGQWIAKYWDRQHGNEPAEQEFKSEEQAREFLSKLPKHYAKALRQDKSVKEGWKGALAGALGGGLIGGVPGAAIGGLAGYALGGKKTDSIDVAYKKGQLSAEHGFSQDDNPYEDFGSEQWWAWEEGFEEYQTFNNEPDVLSKQVNKVNPTNPRTSGLSSTGGTITPTSTGLIHTAKDVKEDSQQDRNARIVAGELNDAIKQRNKELAQRKLQELEKMGYYFDNQGKLRAMGMYEGLRDPKDNPCWKGYKPVGTKKKNGRTVPNCVPKE